MLFNPLSRVVDATLDQTAHFFILKIGTFNKGLEEPLHEVKASNLLNKLYSQTILLRIHLNTMALCAHLFAICRYMYRTYH